MTQRNPLEACKTKKVYDGYFITLLCCKIVLSGLHIKYIRPIVEMLNLVKLKKICDNYSSVFGVYQLIGICWKAVNIYDCWPRRNRANGWALTAPGLIALQFVLTYFKVLSERDYLKKKFNKKCTQDLRQLQWINIGCLFVQCFQVFSLWRRRSFTFLYRLSFCKVSKAGEGCGDSLK